ncbi:MAG: hypothetical protein IIB95_07420 [Candidatus Marinimicrobia bacterium]|nr:hypothetical protein [Candidatus Neomarinimicrobiota bacterium]
MNTFRRTIPILILFTGISLFNINCITDDEPAWNNPFYTEDPHFIPIRTELIMGPENSEEVNNFPVRFEWVSNPGVSEFNFSLDESNWSGWGLNNFVEYDLLDEGDHRFVVKGRYPTLIEEEIPIQRDFTINAVEGPALMFYPRNVSVSIGMPFSIDLHIEEVDDLMGIYAEIVFDAMILGFDGYQVLDDSSSFLRTTGGQVVSFIEMDISSGNIIANIGIVTGNPPGVNGSGQVLRLNFTALLNQNTEIYMRETSRMTKSDLSTIRRIKLVSGFVNVE